MASFQVQSKFRHGRLGEFAFPEEDLSSFSTPYLFPVTFMMTGTTARGGGVWKYALQADRENGFMRNNIALLSETLHFLDYRLTPKQLGVWRDKTIRARYKDEVGVDYKGPIFLDSGGFRLMWRDGLDLSHYGLDLSPESEVQSIVKLQNDLGANIVASLDYPLPPGLSEQEQLDRMRRSLGNAVKAAEYLRENNPDTFLYMAVHGQTPERISEYVRQLFKELNKRGLQNGNYGLAIGSLVPLRGAGRLEQIINLVWATVQAIPAKHRTRIPIHTFGLAGTIMPYLFYSGVDTFDSSTYMQEARAYRYTNHDTRQSQHILDMEQGQITCTCRVCQTIDVSEMQDALMTKSNNKPLSTGHYKSKYYADLAFHNLEADRSVVSSLRQAIQANCLSDYLLEMAQKYPQTKPLLTALSNLDNDLCRKIGRVSIPVSDKKNAYKPSPVRAITLRHHPTDFDINSFTYSPPNRCVLLVLPCSSQKPYSASASHRFIHKQLAKLSPDWQQYVHKVTLSGLYGPVPEEHETHSAVTSYDFLLKPENKAQIALCVERLVTYLQRHGDKYQVMVAYGSTKSYRMVFESAAKSFPRLQVFPQNLIARTSREFYRSTNIANMVIWVGNAIDSQKQKETCYADTTTIPHR